MNTWHRTMVAAGVAAAVLWADSALAAGRTQTRAGNANGTVTRTSTGTQLRQQLRDGSCLTGTATAATKAAPGTGAGDRLRLRDGSCLTK